MRDGNLVAGGSPNGKVWVVSLPMRDGNIPLKVAKPQEYQVVSLPMRDGNYRRTGRTRFPLRLLAYL